MEDRLADSFRLRTPETIAPSPRAQLTCWFGSEAWWSRTSGRSVGLIAAPEPDEGVGQGLLENAAIAVTRGQAEDEAMVVTFGLERRGRTFAGHHPVVMGLLGIFGTQIVFGNM